jgi:hypothetical protein
VITVALDPAGQGVPDVIGVSADEQDRCPSARSLAAIGGRE